MENHAVLRVSHLSKTYASGNNTLSVLQDVSFTVNAGDTCAIVGPSGSGKTTLLALCAGLDHPSRGDVYLCGSYLNDLEEDDRAEVRNRHVGFVFQTFRLLPSLTALENVMVPAELRGAGREARDRAEALLGDVGLAERIHHYPSQLSGGEQQRVAIARAFINRPRILFADEPTGNLDVETASVIEGLLFDLNSSYGTALVLVTHDHELAAKTEQVIQLRGGKMVTDSAAFDYSTTS